MESDGDTHDDNGIRNSSERTTSDERISFDGNISQQTTVNLCWKKEVLRIGTWNVRTMDILGKLELLLEELNRINLEIVGLCETRWDFGHIIRGVTGIFFWGGKVIFPDFFPGVKCFFPVENSHFGRLKTNFRRFQKWKAKKKKKKKKSPHLFFWRFPASISNFSTFSSQFSIFTPFPFFPCLFFPDTSAKISRSEVSGGALCLRHCT